MGLTPITPPQRRKHLLKEQQPKEVHTDTMESLRLDDLIAPQVAGIEGGEAALPEEQQQEEPVMLEEQQQASP